MRNLPVENHVIQDKNASATSTSESSDSDTVTKSSTGALSTIRGWLPKRDSDAKREKETAGA
jgi:hypothetical protein